MGREPVFIRGDFIRCIIVVAIGFLALPRSAYAADEIQVYNAEIAEVGQWTIQRHLNYAFPGPMVLPFPGGLVPNHSLNGTLELAYGLTDWWELGFYVPFAVSNMGEFLSNGFKFRNLFVSPNAGKRDFFYSFMVQISNGRIRRLHFPQRESCSKSAPSLASAIKIGNLL
jgi:hypothetical protein